MRYWQIPEDLVYSVLGIEMGGSEYVHLPFGVLESDYNKQLYYDTLEDQILEVESALRQVLDSVHT